MTPKPITQQDKDFLDGLGELLTIHFGDFEGKAELSVNVSFLDDDGNVVEKIETTGKMESMNPQEAETEAAPNDVMDRLIETLRGTGCDPEALEQVREENAMPIKMSDKGPKSFRELVTALEVDPLVYDVIKDNPCLIIGTDPRAGRVLVLGTQVPEGEYLKEIFNAIINTISLVSDETNQELARQFLEKLAETAPERIAGLRP